MVPETFTENFYIIGCGSLHLQPIKYGNNLVMNFHSCEADTPLEQKSLQIMFMAEREVVQSSCSPSVCLWADFSLYTKCRSTVHFQASRCQAHDPTSLNPKPKAHLLDLEFQTTLRASLRNKNEVNESLGLPKCLMSQLERLS